MTVSEGNPVPLIDDPFAEDIFVTGVPGIFVAQGNLVVTLEALGSDHSIQPPSLYRKVVGRLVMPVHVAQALVLELNGFLETQGLSPSEAVRGAETSQ